LALQQGIPVCGEFSMGLPIFVDETDAVVFSSMVVDTVVTVVVFLVDGQSKF